jgi:hypothetical protein
MKESAKRNLLLLSLLLSLLLPGALHPAGAAPITQAQIGQAFYFNRVDGILINDPGSSQFQGSAQATPGFNLSGSGSGGRNWTATTSNDYAVPRVSSASTATLGTSSSAQSSLIYDFAVSGADGNVPVLVQASGGTAGNGGRMLALLTIQSMSTADLIVNESLDVFGQTQLFSVNQTFMLAANAIYRVTMQTLTTTSNGPVSASAYVDPYFSAPSGYTILTSAGIGNLAPPTVPIPAALPLFATGLGALGILRWRRKKAAAA